VISDPHEGLNPAVTRIFGTTWQRCRVHAGRQGSRLTASFVATALAQEDIKAAKAQWR